MIGAVPTLKQITEARQRTIASQNDQLATQANAQTAIIAAQSKAKLIAAIPWVIGGIIAAVFLTKAFKKAGPK